VTPKYSTIMVPNVSRQLLGDTDVFGTIGFRTAVAAYNGRLVTEAFDALIIILCLECAHMHFVLFDITSHDVLLFLVKADLVPLCKV
jgi:hypothetical protein